MLIPFYFLIHIYFHLPEAEDISRGDPIHRGSFLPGLSAQVNELPDLTCTVAPLIFFLSNFTFPPNSLLHSVWVSKFILVKVLNSSGWRFDGFKTEILTPISPDWLKTVYIRRIFLWTSVLAWHKGSGIEGESENISGHFGIFFGVSKVYILLRSIFWVSVATNQIIYASKGRYQDGTKKFAPKSPSVIACFVKKRLLDNSAAQTSKSIRRSCQKSSLNDLVVAICGAVLNFLALTIMLFWFTLLVFAQTLGF